MMQRLQQRYERENKPEQVKLLREGRKIGDIRGVGLFIGVEMVNPDGTADVETTVDVVNRLKDKGIVQSHGMRWSHVRRGAAYHYSAATVALLSTPLYSNTTLVVLFPTLSVGGTVVLAPKFDALQARELRAVQAQERQQEQALDAKVGAAEHRKQVAVDRLRRVPHDRFEGSDGRPVRGDEHGRPGGLRARAHALRRRRAARGAGLPPGAARRVVPLHRAGAGANADQAEERDPAVQAELFKRRDAHLKAV